MGALTADVPKPMLPVGGRPMLEHVLQALDSAGIEQFLIVVGYRREVIEQHFRASRFRISYRVQERVDGTGSAARLARDFVADEPFLLTFGDILVDPSAYIRCMNELHASTAAVLGVKDVDDPWRGAAVYADADGRITRVIEKPPQGTSTTRWGSAGLYTMRPLAFAYLDRLQPSPRGEYELTSIFDMMLSDGLELRIGPVEGEWRDLGSPQELAAANAELAPETADDGEQR
jgi:UDP-N-acetylglucosamine diphosphorylase / glucose-1-phosphate thymidylyltransferase / UDP-N-acetylgalactosamine diphosphorylase / glucosamine-1-phosphate N-acetyltransferase / galactosamine-1-phosphate N-acetyltransferase